MRLDLGFVPDEELQVYLRAADVVACPFLEIFTSGSVLLAMSFERAVIAPRRGCVTETLDEAGGILYDADDPQGLEGALRVAMRPTWQPWAATTANAWNASIGAGSPRRRWPPTERSIEHPRG